MKTMLPLCIMLASISMLHAQEIQRSNKRAKADPTKEFQKISTEALLLQMLGQTSGTQILQFGNQNVVAIESDHMKATQTGDNQHLYHNKSSTLIPSNMQVKMEGVNNYVEIQGNNSIVENMSINVRGDNRTIIIRNY